MVENDIYDAHRKVQSDMKIDRLTQSYMRSSALVDETASDELPMHPYNTLKIEGAEPQTAKHNIQYRVMAGPTNNKAKPKEHAKKKAQKAARRRNRKR